MITLSIQQPVIPDKTPTNVYKLTVYSMHGDADHDEESVLTFLPNGKSMEDLHLTLDVLLAYEEAGKPYAITKEEWISFIETTGIDTSSIKQDVGDWISDMLAWDMTNDGQYLTTYQGYDLVFYDVNGLKRPIVVERTDGSN